MSAIKPIYDQISTEIHAYISEYFMLGTSTNLSHDTSLLDSGIIDSTGASELVAFLETRYSVMIQDEEFIPDNLDSIAKIAAFIGRKLSTPQAAAG